MIVEFRSLVAALRAGCRIIDSYPHGYIGNIDGHLFYIALN